jgi:hypothetical protein
VGLDTDAIDIRRCLQSTLPTWCEHVTARCSFFISTPIELLSNRCHISFDWNSCVYAHCQAAQHELQAQRLTHAWSDEITYLNLCATCCYKISAEPPELLLASSLRLWEPLYAQGISCIDIAVVLHASGLQSCPNCSAVVTAFMVAGITHYIDFMQGKFIKLRNNFI